MNKRTLEQLTGKKSSTDDSDNEGETYASIKRSKLEKKPIHYVITNIISTNRYKLSELFTGAKAYEFIPFHHLMSSSDLEEIAESYNDLFIAYDNIKDIDSFVKFDELYSATIKTIVDLFPNAKEREDLDVDRVSIPMPFGLFYAVMTQLREAYNKGDVSYDMYATVRDYTMKSDAYSAQASYVQHMLYDEVISASDPKYNDLDTKYLDMIPTFCTVYSWWTPKIVSKQNAGLNLDVDRFKIYVKMGEMIGEEFYDKRDMKVSK